MLLRHGGMIFAELAPVVIVFTKYDLLVRTKKAKLKMGKKNLDTGFLDKSSKEAAQKEFDDFVKRITERMETPMPPYARVSSINFRSFINQH